MKQSKGTLITGGNGYPESGTEMEEKMKYMSGKNKMAESIGKWIATACFCLAAVLFLAPVIQVSAATGKVSASSANIRSSADASSSIVASVLNGNKLTILEETTGTDGNVWYKVEVDADRTGYIRADLVTKDGAASTTTTTTTTANTTSAVNTSVTVNTDGVTEVQPVSATVGKDGVRVRSDATTQGSIVTTVKKDLVVTVTGYKANGSETWYLANFMMDDKEVKGYIRSDFVTLSGELLAPEAQPEVPADDGSSQVTNEPAEAPAYEAEQDGETWYLVDNVAGKKYPVDKLITEAEQNAEKLYSAQKKVSKQKTFIIVLVIILALILMGVSFLAFKVKDMLDDGSFDNTVPNNRRPDNSPATRPAGTRAPAGARPATRPAGEGARPATRPAGEGARPATRPAGEGARPATRPAGEGARPAARPAGEGARPATRPAGEGARPATRPAEDGVRPAARPAAEQSSQSSNVRPVMQGSAGFRGKSKNFIEDDDDFSFEFLNWEDENKK